MYNHNISIQVPKFILFARPYRTASSPTGISRFGSIPLYHRRLFGSSFRIVSPLSFSLFKDKFISSFPSLKYLIPLSSTLFFLLFPLLLLSLLFPRIRKFYLTFSRCYIFLDLSILLLLEAHFYLFYSPLFIPLESNLYISSPSPVHLVNSLANIVIR